MHTIALGVCSSIAIYKALELIRLLQKEKIDVSVIMTRNATRMISPITFSAISQHKVYSNQYSLDTSEIEHITFARQSELLVIAPATANILGKLAHGVADDFLTTFYLAYTGPVIIAPAMNTQMFIKPVVQENIQRLESSGVIFVNPEEGSLACREEGQGRLASPEVICEAIKQNLETSGSLKGKKVMITAGPTHEKIDLVRFISNYSSGKMGFALAREALRRGAHVVLISGPTHLPVPSTSDYVSVTSAEEMRQAVLKSYDSMDIVIMAAAVADYKPASFQHKKIKKSAQPLQLKLEPTVDILAELGKKKKNQVLVGFAAEESFDTNLARLKLKSKKADCILLNSISEPDTGFNVDTNRVLWIDKYGSSDDSPILSKSSLAQWIWDRINQKLL
jgi:phosphopantothenoylcysteine decarboxylase / phosphopantothenate---cysteine ligase